MGRKRRTKKAYTELYDDPTTLFEGCEVILFPNGVPEIWIKSTRYPYHQVVVQASRGPAGMGLTLRRTIGSAPLTASGNLADKHMTVYPPKGERHPDYCQMEIVQMDGTPFAVAHRAWYEGRAEYPGTETEFDSRELEECSECGDLHFDPVTKRYRPCPQQEEGCSCPFVEGDA